MWALSAQIFSAYYKTKTPATLTILPFAKAARAYLSTIYSIILHHSAVLDVFSFSPQNTNLQTPPAAHKAYPRYSQTIPVNPKPFPSAHSITIFSTNNNESPNYPVHDSDTAHPQASGHDLSPSQTPIHTRMLLFQSIQSPQHPRAILLAF